MTDMSGQHFPGDNEGGIRNQTSSESGDEGGPEGVQFPVDTPSANGTFPAGSATEKNQWDLELLGLHNPPHQPLSPQSSKLQGYERSFRHVMRLKETIAEIARDFANAKVIYEKMTLEKVMSAVRTCRKMTLFDLQRAVMSVGLRSSKSKEQLSER
jgi:hypothetical protein